MHRPLPLLLLPASGLLAALVACGGPGAEDGSDGASAPATRSPSAPPATRDEGGAPARTPACAEVRAGIAAFNDGDYDETVARFLDAVPLAEEQLDGSERAEDLLEAVRWYAALPPEDYPDAATSSEEFQRYKAITLTQCDPVPDGAAPSAPPPVPA